MMGGGQRTVSCILCRISLVIRRMNYVSFLLCIVCCALIESSTTRLFFVSRIEQILCLGQIHFLLLD